MDYYCDKCYTVHEKEQCQSCGESHLKPVTKNDYCYLAEVDAMFGQMFCGILDDEHIVYTAVPCGNGIRTLFALKLENLKIYVAYQYWDQAKELFENLLDHFESAKRKELLDHIDKLFVSPRCHKKIKKKVQLEEREEVVAYCANRMIHADRMVNKGRISSCGKGGEYLFFYKENELIVVNSATYEIISAERI